ncbi:hypothetical protein ACOMHN_036065 [Nucella lapillus]
MESKYPKEGAGSPHFLVHSSSQLLASGRLGPHIPSKITTRRAQRNCVLCTQSGKFTASGFRVRTSWECIMCGVALCKEGCFDHFHQSHAKPPTS